jgi:CheY-like chemotaxis protein
MSAALSGLRLLLVEDDSMVRLLLERAASALGAQVVSVETGTLALELLEHTHYDVVLTDLKMPRVSGLDLVAFARRHCPTTGLVVATGFASPEDEARIQQHGAVLLRKPFGGAALESALKRAISIAGAADQKLA